MLLLLSFLFAGLGQSNAVEVIQEADSALARAVAERDEPAFRRLLEDEAIFLGGTEPSRGPDAIVEGWSAFFSDSSGETLQWEPVDGVVAESGELGATTGQFIYRDATGAQIEGSYLTVWRLGRDSGWRVVADGTFRVRPGDVLPKGLRERSALESASGDLRIEYGDAEHPDGRLGEYFAVYLRNGDTWQLYGASHTLSPAEDE